MLSNIRCLSVGLLLLAFSSSVFAEDAGTWVSLFDGKSISDWTVLELGKEQGKSHWKVESGMIEGSGLASMLFSPKGHYKNFRYCGTENQRRR